ncbi:MAG: sugar transferase [Vicinamibacterales bacterium]
MSAPTGFAAPTRTIARAASADRARTGGPGPPSPAAAASDRLIRLIDVTVASVLLAVLAPLLAITWLAVRLDSTGPAIFRQQRLGRHGAPFTLYKFRTMAVHTDDGPHRHYVTALLASSAGSGDVAGEGGAFKLAGDPRITRLGRLLRRSSIDELPQLVNVVRGDMSLVGPRPALAYEAAHYSRRDTHRFAVLPGITGLWQVSGRNLLSMRDMLELDVRFVEHRSLRLYLSILARTPREVLRPSGAR